MLSAPACIAVAKPFTGTICAPASRGRYPAVILVGGSDGGDSFARLAPAFAEHGYVAASVAYFRAPGTPAVLVNVPVEIVGHAIAALQARGDVMPNRIGIVGLSRGGEFALLAASTYPQIKAVVGIVPSPIAFMGLGENDRPDGCAWTLHGKPLPCVGPDSDAGMAITAEVMSQQPVVLAPFYDASRRADPRVTRAAFFHLERIRGPVLCLAGGADAMWNSPALCRLAIAYLREHHHPYADRMRIYPGAGHLFIAASNGPSSAISKVNVGGVTMAFGGTPRGDAAAATNAWRAIWAFLSKALG